MLPEVSHQTEKNTKYEQWPFQKALLPIHAYLQSLTLRHYCIKKTHMRYAQPQRAVPVSAAVSLGTHDVRSRSTRHVVYLAHRSQIGAPRIQNRNVSNGWECGGVDVCVRESQRPSPTPAAPGRRGESRAFTQSVGPGGALPASRALLATSSAARTRIVNCFFSHILKMRRALSGLRLLVRFEYGNFFVSNLLHLVQQNGQ